MRQTSIQATAFRRMAKTDTEDVFTESMRGREDELHKAKNGGID